MARQWTDITIRNLPLPETGSRKLFDPSLPGFGIRLTKRSRTFIVQYGKDRKVRTIGRYPQFSLREARKVAIGVLDGYDPQKPSESNTELLRAFLEDCRARLRPSTVERYTFALAPHTEKIDHTTTNPNELKALKAFYNWCIDHGYRTDNPLARRRVVFNQRSRVLSDEEVGALLRYSHPPYSSLIHLLLLTGQRRNQFAHFHLDWVQDHCIHFPATIMKTKRPHTIPLTDRAARLLPDLKPMSGWSKAKV